MRMQAHLTPRARNQRNQQAAALVIILGFVVLLTVLVAVFLSRVLLEQKIANASANQARVDIMARSAIDMILGDLKQEIATNTVSSKVVINAGTANQTSLYFPLTATNMVPQRSGNPTDSSGTDLIPNLVRRSVRSDTITVPSRASAVNSATDASANGRSVTPARWNRHYLIPRLKPGSATIDSTPIATFAAPDWVMVTTAGPKVLTVPDPATIGRYTYAIYDEGGLLDVNAAGFPSSLTASQISGKGSLALADLTALSDTNATPLWTVGSTEMNNLVGWRNYATLQPSGSLGNYSFTAAAGTNYYTYISTMTNGFLTVNSQTTSGNRTDQAFTSRQSLLKFQRATGLAQDALQYLGTFSRDLEQPTFAPDPNRPKNTSFNVASGNLTWIGYGGNDAYSADGSRQDLLNPSLLTVRDASGQPVMKRRFPLSRLGLLQESMTTLRNGGTLSATEAQNLYQYFGLTWDTLNNRWIYFHEDAATSHVGTVPSAKILKLSDIAALNAPSREPDFFETLLAVINCESIAKQNGLYDDTVGTGLSPHRYISGAAAIDGKVYYQIMQMGVNLIDQYGTGSYPTRIAFDPVSLHDFYGVKNLPYLAGWMESWYRMKQLTSVDLNPSQGNNPTTYFPYETWTLCQPIIWNPHAPNANLDTTQVPTKFRVVAGSMGGASSTAVQIVPQVRPSWWQIGPVSSFPASSAYASANQMKTTSGLSSFTYAPSLGISTSVTLTPPSLTDSSTSGSALTFTATPNTAGSASSRPPVDAYFHEPCRLLYQFPPGSNADAAEAQGKFTLDNYGAVVDTVLAQADASNQGQDGKTVIGFFTGKCWTGSYQYLVPSADFNPLGEFANCLVNGYISGDFQLSLQYYDPAFKTWVAYDTISNVYQLTGGGGSLVDNADTAPSLRAFRNAFRIDPRTDRWGLPDFWTSPLAVNPTGGGITAPTAITPSIATKAPARTAYKLPLGTTLSPNSGSSAAPACQYLPNSGSGQPTGWAVGHTVNNAVCDYSVNTDVGTTSGANSYIPGGKAFYFDPDGVLRRAGGALFNSTTAKNTNDGLPLATGNYNSRPVILNRPFQSVAEMGHAFSDTPWKDINFFAPESGDSALLEAFCLNELSNAPGDVTVAGRVNLNTRQPKVLQALIQGVSKAEGGIITTAEAVAAAQALVTWTTNTATSSGVLTNAPLRNRSELVGKFIAKTPAIASALTSVQSNTLNRMPGEAFYDGYTSYSGYSSVLTAGTGGVFANATDAAIKRRRECVLRALADSGNTRTWNLLIDVIAQTGKYPATAKTAADLPKFIVTGETRYWVHVAIDRYTGTIIAESLEPVAE